MVKSSLGIEIYQCEADTMHARFGDATKSEAPRELEFLRGFCAQHHVRRWRALGLILGELLPIGIAPTRPLALSLHDLLLLQGPVRGYVRRLLEREPSKAAQQR